MATIFGTKAYTRAHMATWHKSAEHNKAVCTWVHMGALPTVGYMAIAICCYTIHRHMHRMNSFYPDDHRPYLRCMERMVARLHLALVAQTVRSVLTRRRYHH